jgi:hypothetical protein
MLAGNSSWTVDDFLLLGLIFVLGPLCFVSLLEVWRRWSEYRRIRNHFRH